jgi:cell wall-associated NlpC family hydrolase
MGITFNDSDIINIEDTETGLKMLDKLSRIKDGRRIDPLDALDNIHYEHRYLYDVYNLQIGDTYFMIPPEFIMVNSESTSQSIVTLRQENTQKMKSGHHKRIILIDLVFNGLEQLNGYPVDGPEGTYYVDGLRQLLAQFKCTPFLPISNELINGMYGIFTVALQSITMSTMQGFPDVMTAQITLQEVNMFPYLEMPDVCFKYMIDWDLFRFYYQRFLTEDHVYRKLQSLPANKSFNRFKLSILDESVFISENATRSNMLHIIKDEFIVGEGLESNYTTWVDSEEDNIFITSFQCGYSNILTNIQLSDMPSPTVQFLGGMDTIYNITFETTDYSVVQAIEQCQITNDLLTRNNIKMHSVGFVKLESELVEFTGSLFVLIDSVVTNTVPGFPGLYNVQINCVSYDIAQSDREELHGFRPFDCDENDCINNNFDTQCIHSEQAIEQTMDGLKTKVKQDNYAEWKIRTTMEVYPDLHLPTYAEVNEFIKKCITFRKNNELEELPYTEYPTNPTGMLHGQNPDNNITFDKEEEHGIYYTKDVNVENAEYNIFVDPDFYVFYPSSYMSFKDEMLENGEDFYGHSPVQRTATVKTKTKVTTPSYNGSTASNAELIEQFIALARSFIGHTYIWGAEGEISDSKGLCFDCSGFVTYLLKEIGVMPASEGRFTVKTMPGNDLFETIPWDQMKRGDILCNSALTHVVIYEGDNKIVHAANKKPYPDGGVKDGTLYFNSGTCLRPKAFTQQSTSTNGSTGSNGNFYATDEFVDMVKQWEGFLSKATSMDGGIDIGYGFHNQYFDGTKYVKIEYGMTMTQEEATKYLKLELESLIPSTIAKLEKYGWNPQDFTNNQILALTSYYYNRGYYNSSADAILDKANSPTVDAIGQNLPNYWGKASYAKQGLINRRKKEQTLFFTPDNGDVSAADVSDGTNLEYVLTSAEFESICRVVMAETIGEGSDVEKAMAQVIYDRLTASDKRFGGLSNILQSADQFKAPYEEELNSTVENNVKEVFCNNNKYWPDYQALYFLTAEDTNASFKDRDSKYDRLGEIGTHVFWGKESQGSTVKYTISDDGGTGSASSNIFEEMFNIAHNAKTLNDIKKFAEPVVAKTDAIMYDDNWVFWKNATNKDNAKNYLNDGENIFNTSFCDEYQYSCRGRLVRAFPAYLFCVLDDNAQWFDGKKLWTNYYIHRSMIDIAVHATNDMPTETATIIVSNAYHNLDRTQGGLSGYSIANDEGYNDFQRWFYKHTGLLLGLGPKLTDKLIQLHQVIYDHTKLREGARVHLRIGYGSDPLSLAPVMNGHISDISLGDQIQIVVTSDGHELIQHITSTGENRKKKDVNSGFLGLFGLGDDQESSNIIANILCERQSWFTYLAKQTFEGSKYGIEHYGLYFNSDVMGLIVGIVTGALTYAAVGAALGSFVPGLGTLIGFGVGTLVGIGISSLFGSETTIADAWNGFQEQYDICKNIYKGDYSREHYIYTDALGADGEQNVVFNKYNMTPWDVFQVCTQQVPEYIVKSSYHQFDSRLYFGLPFWMEKYRYDYLGGEGKGIVVEECKASSQVHIIDFTNIIDNQVRVTSKFSSTNVKVMYTQGEDPVSTDVIHSDDTIDFAYQKTTILDSPITQDALGPDAIYEFLGYKVGADSARRVGISNLLYGWQQQYQGQIIMLGNPGIKPNDYVMICDSFAKLYGIAIVREVTHSFSINTGFTTSITLGMIGFSTDENSGLIETCQNLLSVLACFSSYLETRREIKNNYEKNINLFSDLELMRDKFVSVVNRSKGLKTAEAIASIGPTIMYARVAYKTVKSLRNAKGMKDIVTKTAKAAKIVFKAAKTGKAIKTASTVTKLVKGLLSFNPVTLVVTIVIDALISEIFEWLENRNVCVLLPLWWEDYPFVCNTKDGENILLLKVNDMTDEQYGGPKDIKEETEIDG